MIEEKSKTTDLAAHIHAKMNRCRLALATPPLIVFGELFECLFYTSMRTEESELTKVAVTLIDPANPDPTPPRKIVSETIKQNVLLTRYPDVFTIRPVSKIIREYAGEIRAEIKAFLLASHPGEDFADWEEFADSIWPHTLSRLQLKIQNYHHGGAVQISADGSAIDIKYALNYKRLLLAIIGYLEHTINSYVTEHMIDQRLTSGKQTVTRSATTGSMQPARVLSFPKMGISVYFPKSRTG
jgi:hypothetical protein